jgi:hypothetical protein
VDADVAFERRHRTFHRVSKSAPSLEVDTTDGYLPSLSQIVAFVNSPDCGHRR